jgi:hypothetical protein
VLHCARNTNDFAQVTEREKRRNNEKEMMQEMMLVQWTFQRAME